VLGGCLCLARPAGAQIPVIDAANLVQNTWSSLQNTIQAVQLVLSVANQVLELTGLEALAVDNPEMADAMQHLYGLAAETSAVLRDGRTLEWLLTDLFSLQGAPRTSAALAERLSAIRRVQYDAYFYSMRTTQLLHTAASTVQHIQALVGHLLGVLGAKQNTQVTNQLLTKLNQTAAAQQVQTTALQQGQTLQMLETPLVRESIGQIHEGLLADHPR